MRQQLKQRKHGSGVELNMAAMLDMAFQLLTFFILTFRPAPIEGQVLLRLPKPQPLALSSQTREPGDTAISQHPHVGLSTLHITALSRPNGSLGELAVGGTSVGTLHGLDRRLRDILTEPNTGIDQVLIEVDSSLSYESLMQVIDICTHQKLAGGNNLTKLSFVELTEGT